MRCASTSAFLGAEVERFLKKGIRESSLEGFCGGVGGFDNEESNTVSEPVWDNEGVVVFGISPKYCSANLTASLCWTPANATTIRSGL